MAPNRRRCSSSNATINPLFAFQSIYWPDDLTVFTLHSQIGTRFGAYWLWWKHMRTIKKAHLTNPAACPSQISRWMEGVVRPRLTCPLAQVVGGQEAAVAQHPHSEPGEQPGKQADSSPGRGQGPEPEQRGLRCPQHPFPDRHGENEDECSQKVCLSDQRGSKCNSLRRPGLRVRHFRLPARTPMIGCSLLLS